MKRTHRFLALTLALLTLLLTFASCKAEKDSMENLADGGYNNSIYPSLDGKQENAEKDPSDVEPETTPNGVVENPFIATAENNVSTFSADVDTASYSYFRKLVNQGYKLDQLVSAGKNFRTEEFINYFDYDVRQPGDGELFGVDAEFIGCPWSSSTVLLRMTLQAETAVETSGNNLVFLIDVSGSMNNEDKLPLLQKTFSSLVDQLSARDRVSIVTYSGKEAVVLDGCAGDQRDRILNAINDLSAYGSTNGQVGLERAYEIAAKNRIEGGNNRIIMASDGDLNVGISSEAELKAFIAEKRAAGIYLSVMGFGTGNYQDAKMETLADNGNGVYYYIDGESEAEKVLGSDLLGTLYTVAEDVKLQLTFDTRYVSSYRLIGYENRILNEEDFDDDTKDAGEVGAGHQVTVCYELTLNEGARDASDAWLKLAVRYKDPGETQSLLNEYALGAANLSATVSEDMKFLSCLIQTVMILHQSRYLNGATIEGIAETLNSLDLTAHPDRAEFRDLINKLV